MVRHRRFIFSSSLVVGLVLVMLIPVAVQGADHFASPAFEQQWNSVEGTIPNFWGPLATARNGQIEPYAEGNYNGDPGSRLVQYFDKARMEQTTPDRPVTNGLLTVELKSGRLQVGDVSFEQRNRAAIGIAGDQDAPGPTYATLNGLAERVAQRRGAVDRGYDGASKTFVNVQPASDPELSFVTYQGDPGGRFGQNVPKAFWDYLQAIPGGWLPAMGYPISEAFGTQVQVNGQSTFVVVQAFERRVLTYTPSNAANFRVEFGNIGRHYYRWRYGTPVAPPPALPPAPISGADAVFVNGVISLTNRNSNVFPLGPATGAASLDTLAYEPFENGFMLYSQTTNQIYVLSRTGMQLAIYPNTFVENGLHPVMPGPRAGTYIPVRGFGTVWQQNPDVQQALGFATAPERGYSALVQRFARGFLLDDPADTLIFALNTVTNRWDSATR